MDQHVAQSNVYAMDVLWALSVDLILASHAALAICYMT